MRKTIRRMCGWLRRVFRPRADTKLSREWAQGNAD